MTISKANKSDAEEILSVQKAAFQTEAEIHNMYDIQPLAQTLAELLKEFDLGPVLKVSHNGQNHRLGTRTHKRQYSYNMQSCRTS